MHDRVFLQSSKVHALRSLLNLNLLLLQVNQFHAYGALVGGPQSDDSFEDSRGWCCAAYNEVAIDYNAGFTGAIARLVDYYKDQRLFSDCGLDLGWEHPNATLVSHLLSPF